jgi:hypothetical protein
MDQNFASPSPSTDLILEEEVVGQDKPISKDLSELPVTEKDITFSDSHYFVSHVYQHNKSIVLFAFV